MSMIDVNHRTLRDVAAAITTYCTAQDREMRIADTEIKSMLTNGWLGMDADEFRRKWAGVNANDSTAVRFRESLKNYGECLVACANEYENAQADAVNAAGLLMRLVGR
jgi:hypothetical protein